MLRPATPLAIIFLLAFVLLLISTISVPIVKGIPIAAYDGYTFGVFGYCGPSTGCLSPTIGYNSDDLPASIQMKFSLSSAARHSLSSILIVHPVAAFLTLICFGLAVAAHFHAPSHSPRYLLALLILTVPTLLVTLLAFLVDILLFIPHVQWGGWIVLAATILIVASSVMTCAMRRTLVSRKARKKRIAENADMSGANYYDNLAASRAAAHTVQPIPATPQPAFDYARAESPPPMTDGASGKGGFAAFEMHPQDARSTDGDDRTPLNPGRDPSIRSTSTGGRRAPPYGPGDAPPMPMDANGRPRRPSRDQYGNPIPPGAYYGDLPPPSLRHRGSQGSLGSNGSGRRGRGGYGPGGPMPPRGGFRGGPPPPGWRGRGRGGYGPPPRGFGPPRGRGGYPPRGGYGPPPPSPGMTRGPPPPEYIVDSPYYDMAGGHDTLPPTDQPPQGDHFVAMPHLPIGTAIEMDERTGSPQAHMSPLSPHAPGSPIYGNEVDGAGDLHMSSQPHNGFAGNRSPVTGNGNGGETNMTSPTSIYSHNEAYVPARAQWAHGESNSARMSPVASSPIRHGATQSPRPYSPPARHVRSGSESYYEDVDPRFAVDEPQPQSDYHGDNARHASPAPGLPGALTPGGMTPGTMENTPGGFPTTPGHQMNVASGERFLDPNLPTVNLPSDNPSFENIPEGARSPAEGSERMSEASHFTSISQRGINPNWQPGPGSANYAGGSSASAVQRRREDVILSANPDFSIPGVGALRGGRPARGRSTLTPGGAMAASSLGAGLTPMGRYPTDI